MVQNAEFGAVVTVGTSSWWNPGSSCLFVGHTYYKKVTLDLIKSLDTTKATGPDGIGPRLLYEAGYTIVPSLTKLINLCLSSAQVPQMWKHANVMPLFKKDDSSKLNNYRPVSLLSCTSKILERIVFKTVFKYLREQHPHFSSGFQPGDSTVNQLAYLYHVFSHTLDRKKDVRIVFCDISKAFDRVWHEGLLFKLERIGIGGNLLKFFKHYYISVESYPECHCCHC